MADREPPLETELDVQRAEFRLKQRQALSDRRFYIIGAPILAAALGLLATAYSAFMTGQATLYSTKTNACAALAEIEEGKELELHVKETDLLHGLYTLEDDARFDQACLFHRTGVFSSEANQNILMNVILQDLAPELRVEAETQAKSQSGGKHESRDTAQRKTSGERPRRNSLWKHKPEDIVHLDYCSTDEGKEPDAQRPVQADIACNLVKEKRLAAAQPVADGPKPVDDDIAACIQAAVPLRASCRAYDKSGFHSRPGDSCPLKLVAGEGRFFPAARVTVLSESYRRLAGPSAGALNKSSDTLFSGQIACTNSKGTGRTCEARAEVATYAFPNSCKDYRDTLNGLTFQDISRRKAQP